MDAERGPAVSEHPHVTALWDAINRRDLTAMEKILTPKKAYVETWIKPLAKLDRHERRKGADAWAPWDQLLDEARENCEPQREPYFIREEK